MKEVICNICSNNDIEASVEISLLEKIIINGNEYYPVLYDTENYYCNNCGDVVSVKIIERNEVKETEAIIKPSGFVRKSRPGCRMR